MEPMTMSRFMVLLGQDSVQAGVLVLAVLLVQKMLGKRLVPRWRSGLWLLVMARLLLVVSIGSAVSVFNLLPHTRAKISPIAATSLAGAPPIVPDADAGGTIARTVEHPAPLPEAKQSSSPQNAEPTQLQPSEHPAAAPVPARRERTSWNAWARILFRVWLGGVVCLLLYILAGSFRIYRHLSQMPSLNHPKLLELLAECKVTMQVRGELDLVESPRVATPALHGFLRPKLMLPPGFAAKFSAQELRFVLLHELAHVKRRDILLNWLASMLQVVHWFNPFIWFGFARWRADRELACDALALEASGGDQNRAYGQTILRLLENFSHRASMPGLVGILEDKRQLHRRIGMIANYVPAKKWPVAALLIVGVLAAVGLTDAQNNTSSSNSNAKKEKSAAVTAGTETPEAAPEPRPVVTDGAAMKVTVLDDETGKPLAGAEVLAPNEAAFFTGEENSPHWFTGPEGVATIRLGKPSTGRLQKQTWFTLSARHENYSPRGFSWSDTDEDVRTQLPAEVTVRLPHGVSAGGVVRDAAGNPVEGVRVRVFGTDYWQGLRHEFSEYWSDSAGAPVIVTDASGHWQAPDFPRDMTQVRIEFTCPGGALLRFVQEGESDPREPGNPINLDEFKADKAVFVLPEGKTIRGMVVDENGKGIGGARMMARSVMAYSPAPYVFTNNADGSFELQHWNDVQVLLAVEAPNHATTTAKIVPAHMAPNIRIVLPPAKPLRIRVVGEKNEPIVGAGMSVIYWRTRDQILDWGARTDEHGEAVWSNAPVQRVAIWIVASNYPARSANLAADGTEKTIRLSKESGRRISVHLHAVDADSGQPLKTFGVFRDLQWDHTFKAWGRAGEDGEFREQVNASEFREGTEPYFTLQIRVEGYAPWTSDGCYFEDGDAELDAKLKKSPVPAGVVLQPDGKPAANATVMLNLGQSAIFANAPGRYYPNHGSPTEHTDKDGSFHFMAADKDEYVVISHPSGFLSLTVGELTRAHEVQLKPWATVDGVLRVNGKPLAGQSVDVRSPINWSGVEDLILVYSAKTDGQGHFSFTNLPPGDYVLYRTPHLIMGATTTESHQLTFDLQAGEHKQLDYGFGGRDVVGHVDTDIAVNWQNDAQVLVAKVAPPPPAPTSWQYADNSDYQKALRSYEHSPEVRAAERKQQQFQLIFDEDGNFRADDVPPGTYELRLRLTKPPEPGKPRIPFQEQELASLKKEVVIPAGSEAFDLGLLNLPVSPDAGLKTSGEKAAPVAFSAHRLDGSAFKLSDFKGQFVVVTFWASWSDRCTEQMAELQKIQKELAGNERVKFLDINVDGDAAALRKVIEARGYQGTHGWLDTTDLATLSKTFDVNSLPATYLIDPENRLANGNLPTERVKTTLLKVASAR
jgi:beta-lactamase regulating signal transducer with metallopeptidase domain/thiol-disulfide isomerase/thioredoxin